MSGGPGGKPAGLPSHWKRRIFVLVMYAVAVTLITVHFTVLSPDLESYRFRVDSEIAKLDKETIERDKPTIQVDFHDLEKKGTIDRVMLVAAFGFGLAALTIGGVWSFIETHRGGRESYQSPRKPPAAA